MTDPTISGRPSNTGRDLKFAGTIAAGLCAGVLGVGAIAVPLLGWDNWPEAHSTADGKPIMLTAVPDSGKPHSGAGGSQGRRTDGSTKRCSV